MTSAPRTHSAAIGLTFEEWNAWRAAAKEAGYGHLSDWVRDVVAAATESAQGDEAKRELTRELVTISAHLGAITDALDGQNPPAKSQELAAAADRAAAELARLAQGVIDRW